jgi:type I restriction enzyme S subunit
MKWRNCLVGDFVGSGVAHIQTGPFGTQLKASDYVSEGTPVINVRNIGLSDLRPDKLEYVPEEITHRLSEHLLIENDIVFGRKGAVDRHLFVEAEQEGWMQGSDCIRLRFEADAIHPRFVSYAFLQENHKQWMIVQSGSKATMASLNQDIIKRIPLQLPSLSIQEEIVWVLSAYDNLIENNRRRMALLEESARLLYREWFVRLRFPGHEHTRIVDGVPEGWERRRLDELTSFLKRGITPHYDEEAGGLVINQKCIRDGRVNLNFARRQSREFKPDRQIQIGDVLVNSTGEGTLGRVAQIKVFIENCTVDTHVTIVRPRPEIPRHYFGLAVMEWEPRFSTMGKGATNQTELSPAAIGGVDIVIPSHALLEQFELFAEPIYQQTSNLISQNEKLRAARDLLLPRLMSGEIAV